MSNEKLPNVARVEEAEDAKLHERHIQVKPSYEYDDMHQAALEDNPDKATFPSLGTLLSILFLSMSIVAPIGCGFIVAASVLFQVATELDGIAELGWVISGWSVASSVSFSLAGSISDVFGRRYVIMCGQLLSLMGAAIAAKAQNINVLIAGSTCLGFACGCVLVSYAGVAELLPNKYRGLGVACIEGFLTIPWVAGAFITGNLLLVHTTWRWIYYICNIYAAVSLLGTAIFYFPPKGVRKVDSSRDRWQQFLELDFIGYVLYAAGLASVLLGLSWGGTDGHAWASKSVILPIVLGVVSFVTVFVYDFIVVEPTGRRALFPREMLCRFCEFSASLVVFFLAGMIYYPMSALLPQATSQVLGNTPIQVGILLLPNGLGQTVFTGLAPTMIHLTKRPKLYAVVSVILQTLFTGFYAYAIGGHKAAWSAFQFFGAGPFGLIQVALVLNLSLHVRPSELGIATGLIGTFRSMGGSIGNAIFGAILRSVSAKQVPQRIIAATLAQGYKGDLSTIITAVISAANGVPNAFASVPGITPEIERAGIQAYQRSYAQAYRIVFYSTIPIGVVAILACVMVKDSTKYMTNHVHVQLERDVLKRRGRNGEEEIGRHERDAA